MENKSLAVAFGDSLSEDVVGCLSDLAEIGLDAIMDEGVLKEVPLLSTVVAVYKISSSIIERHNLKKLIAFLKELNSGVADEHKRAEYQQKFKTNEKFRNQEIEYLLVLIQRYISYDKPLMLAKLYLAYLDSKITWNEFVKCAEIIDRIFCGDMSYLNERKITSINSGDAGIDSVLRLLSIGLVVQGRTKISDDGKGHVSISSGYSYVITPLGKKLASILNF